MENLHTEIFGIIMSNTFCKIGENYGKLIILEFKQSKGMPEKKIALLFYMFIYLCYNAYVHFFIKVI